MSLVLTVDGERWRAHLRAMADNNPGLVPVAKGNGYGFGLARLARKTGWLGLDTLAVGTYEELPEVAPRYGGSLLVMAPWRPFGAALEVDPALAGRVIHSVGRLEDLAALLEREPGARFVLEQLTSMRRHGLSARQLWEAGDLLRRRGGAHLEGVALHLPLARGEHLPEVGRLLTEATGAGLRTATVWVSHLTPAELERLRADYPDLAIRPRIGTDLWLGDRNALSATATVLDVHEVSRGQAYGYRGRTAPRRGHLVVVSGGTAHGLGFTAPMAETRLRAKAATVARSGLEAAGLLRSPFLLDGKQRYFAEPPHMQASMLFLPHGSRVPDVGESVEVRVRYTATTFDRVVLG